MNELEKQKVLFVINTSHILGGAEKQAIILAEGFKEKGLIVQFLSFTEGKLIRSILEKKGISLIEFPFDFNSGKVHKLIAFIKLIRLIRYQKIDVIIPYVAESNLIIGAIWKYTGAKFVFWNQREEGRGLFGNNKEKRRLKNVSAIVSNSYEGKDFLCSKFNLSEEDVHVINNGVILPEEVRSKGHFRSKYCLSEKDIIISMIANISPRKDHKTLIEAWSIVIENYTGKDKLKLILGGRLDVRQTEILKLLSFDLGVCESIIFTGFLENPNILIEESLFCVFSSRLEGCPNGILEAMAMKKAVISTDISGARQAIGNEFEKITFSNPDSPEDLAQKILNLLNNNDLRYKIERTNYERIKSEFSTDQLINNYLSLFNQRFIQS